MSERTRIEVDAPYVQRPGEVVLLEPGERYGGPWGRGVIPYMDATIRIDVRPLEGAELGALRSTGAEFSRHVHRAVERKNEEDLATYGMTTAEMRRQSQQAGYYESPAHVAWSQAAEARTGGRLTAEWWRGFDPYGGTNGHGPEILAGGLYPHPLSRIGMAHDTDWSLGRHFQAGPLRELYGVGHDAKTRGEFGVVPNNPINRWEDIYSDGHPDWNVDYRPRGNQRSQEAAPGAVAAGGGVGAPPQADPMRDSLRAGVERLDTTALGLTDRGQVDRVVAALDAESRQRGITAPNEVVASTDGQRIFAVQGDPNRPDHLRASVEVAAAARQPVETSERLIRESAPALAVEPALQEARARGVG